MKLIISVAMALSAASALAGQNEKLAAAYCTCVAARCEPGPDMFTVGLLQAVTEARARHDAYDARLPITELDLDAACAVHDVRSEGEATTIEIEHAVPHDSASDWYDTLVAIGTANGLRIDDIRFGAPERTLRGALIDPSIRVLAE